MIDMFCYRRHGHNEGDEAMFTQPLMLYRAIGSHPTTLEIYGKKLIAEGVVTAGEVEKMKSDWRARLDVELEASQSYKSNKADWLNKPAGPGSRSPRCPTIRAAAIPASPSRRSRRSGRRSPWCRRASTSTAPSSVSSKPAAR